MNEADRKSFDEFKKVAAVLGLSTATRNGRIYFRKTRVAYLIWNAGVKYGKQEVKNGN